MQLSIVCYYVSWCEQQLQQLRGKRKKKKARPQRSAQARMPNCWMPVCDEFLRVSQELGSAESLKDSLKAVTNTTPASVYASPTCKMLKLPLLVVITRTWSGLLYRLKLRKWQPILNFLSIECEIVKIACIYSNFSQWKTCIADPLTLLLSQVQSAINFFQDCHVSCISGYNTTPFFISPGAQAHYPHISSCVWVFLYRC